MLDTWDQIMDTLENKGAAANLMSVDFAKAFNRMDHHRCLEALADLGASMESIDWTASFLYGRSMSVRIGNEKSEPR